MRVKEIKGFPQSHTERYGQASQIQASFNKPEAGRICNEPESVLRSGPVEGAGVEGSNRKVTPGGCIQEPGHCARVAGVLQERWQVERPVKQLPSVVPGKTGVASREGGNGDEDRPPQRPRPQRTPWGLCLVWSTVTGKRKGH